jgi:hypothetical protein
VRWRIRKVARSRPEWRNGIIYLKQGREFCNEKILGKTTSPTAKGVLIFEHQKLVNWVYQLTNNTMRLNLIILACCSLLMISGCNKSTGPSGNPVIEYEITSTTPFATNILGTPFPGLSVNYTNETGQLQQEQLSISGIYSWKKKVVITTPQRPIVVSCTANGILTGSGKVETKVYVDGVLRGSNTVNAYEGQGYWTIPTLFVNGILIQ